MREETAAPAQHDDHAEFRALAADYDGTLADQGRVATATIQALERFRAAGRLLVLVTGRTMDQLRRDFEREDLFDRVVAENGALLYRPDDGSERLLAESAPAVLIERLRERGVDPLTHGRSIVATWRPHEETVRAAVQDLGLDHELIFNKGAVMVLPRTVNKASGLVAALEELGVSPDETVAVGDAENDLDFLSIAGRSVAVANALPSVKDRADLVTEGDHGRGIVELVEGLLAGRWLPGREGLAAS